MTAFERHCKQIDVINDVIFEIEEMRSNRINVLRDLLVSGHIDEETQEEYLAVLSGFEMAIQTLRPLADE